MRDRHLYRELRTSNLFFGFDPHPPHGIWRCFLVRLTNPQNTANNPIINGNGLSRTADKIRDPQSNHIHGAVSRLEPGALVAPDVFTDTDDEDAVGTTGGIDAGCSANIGVTGIDVTGCVWGAIEDGNIVNIFINSSIV